MFQHQGIWLPDGEKHFPEWMDANGEILDGRGTYQIKKWRACLPYIKNWRVAVDVGAHVGLWLMQMTKQFEIVHCFEPVKELRACLRENMSGDKNFSIHPVALGAKKGSVFMSYDPKDSGNTHIGRAAAEIDDDPESVPIETLDSFQLENVDFVKIDCEGYEDFVIEGAHETLSRWKPCVIVEQKQHKLMANFGIKGTPAVILLTKLGAKIRKVISDDYIMTWDS